MLAKTKFPKLPGESQSVIVCTLSPRFGKLLNIGIQHQESPMRKTSSAKDSRIDLRVTQEQKALLEQAASLKGISLSAYTILHLLPLAQQDIAAQERLTLSDRDRDLLMASLDNPPVLQGDLKSVIAKHREKYGL
jgi:uncharacterized protein (DUF1778 family)